MGNLSTDIIIADELRDLIEYRIFKPGEKLPSERDLCERFNCSRTLIRQSISTLEHEGWITSIEKSGHFVSYPRFRVALNSFQSNTKLFREAGLNAEKKMINFEVIAASAQIAKKLEISLGEDVFFIQRVRYVEETPVSIEVGYLPKAICPTLLEKDIITNSLYEIIAEDYNIHVDRSRERITLELSTKEEAKILKIDKNTPVIKKSEIVYSNTNDIIEYTENIMIMERFEFVK